MYKIEQSLTTNMSLLWNFRVLNDNRNLQISKSINKFIVNLRKKRNQTTKPLNDRHADKAAKIWMLLYNGRLSMNLQSIHYISFSLTSCNNFVKIYFEFLFSFFPLQSFLLIDTTELLNFSKALAQFPLPATLILQAS